MFKVERKSIEPGKIFNNMSGPKIVKDTNKNEKKARHPEKAMYCN